MFRWCVSEALSATDIYEKIGAAKDVEDCRVLLRKIEEAASHEVDPNGKLLEAVLLLTPANPPLSA